MIHDSGTILDRMRLCVYSIYVIFSGYRNIQYLHQLPDFPIGSKIVGSGYRLRCWTGRLRFKIRPFAAASKTLVGSRRRSVLRGAWRFPEHLNAPRLTDARWKRVGKGGGGELPAAVCGGPTAGLTASSAAPSSVRHRLLQLNEAACLLFCTDRLCAATEM